MKPFLTGAAITYLLQCVTIAKGIYWSSRRADRKGNRFEKEVGCLSGLEVPDVIFSMPNCDSRCQTAEKSYVDYLCTISHHTSSQEGLTFCNSEYHHCDWDGIICLQETKHIIAIDLADDQVHGSCIKNTEALQYLLALCFDSNNCHDILTNIFSVKRNHLMVINFGDTMISGLFPKEITENVPNIAALILFNTRVSGPLPSTLLHARKLEILDLSGTDVNVSSVFSVVTNLTSLKKLALDKLGIFSELSVFRNLSQLEQLRLDNNQIFGCIPLDFSGRLPRLQGLYLEENNIGCQLPPTIKNWKYLKVLKLSGNRELGGLVPASIYSMPRLRVFDISKTSILGYENGVKFSALSSLVIKDCPKFVLSLQQLIASLRDCRKTLTYLQVRNTKLEGNLRLFRLDNFPRLTVMDLSKNRELTGNLARIFRKNPNLVRIDLSYCSLEGELPMRSLGRLSELSSIDIRGNDAMSSSAIFSYIEFDYDLLSTVWDGANYECPNVKLKDSETMVHVDSEYFGRRHCICLNGYYGQGGFCRKCMNGAVCEKNSAAFNRTTLQFPIISSMRTKKGYRPVPREDNVQYMKRCHTLTVLEDKMFEFICYLNHTRKNLTSLEHTYCRWNYTCPVGYGGKSCLHCLPGYYSLQGICMHCEGDPRVLAAASGSLVFFCGSLAIWVRCNFNTAALVIISVELITSLLLSAFQLIPGWVAKIYALTALLSLSGRSAPGRGILKICFILVQLVEALFFQPTGPFQGPQIMEYIFSIFSFRINSVECLFSVRLSNTDKYILNLVFPFLVSVCIWTAFGMWLLVKNKQFNLSHSMESYLSRLTITMFNLAYFPVVQKTLVFINSCRLSDKDPCRATDKESWCPDQDFKLIIVLASIGTCLYVFGVPVAFGILLYRNRRLIETDDESVASWLGSLFLPYRYQHPVGMYMEILLLLRRLLIAILLVFVSDHVVLQSFLLSFVFLVSLVIEARLKPFQIIKFWSQGGERQERGARVGVENVVELAGLSLLLLGVVWIRMPLLARRLEQSDLYWVRDVLLAMFSFLGLFGIIVALRRLCCTSFKHDENSLLLKK